VIVTKFSEENFYWESDFKRDNVEERLNCDI